MLTWPTCPPTWPIPASKIASCHSTAKLVEGKRFNDIADLPRRSIHDGTGSKCLLTELMLYVHTRIKSFSLILQNGQSISDSFAKV